MNFHYTEVELEIGFTFDEGQKLILAPNDIAQEGIDASVTINGLYIDGALIEVDLPREWYEKLETEIMEKRVSLMEAAEEDKGEAQAEGHWDYLTGRG